MTGEKAWKAMSLAPKDRRILLHYKMPLFTGINIVVGHFDHDKGIKKPAPYWTNDLVRLKGIINTRRHQPDGWMELPDAANSGD